MFSKANTSEGSFSLFTNVTAISIIIAFSIVMLFYILGNAFWRKVRKDKYTGTRFTTKNIAYITMLSSVSVVATIVVSLALPFTVLPPIRIAIEGLMIKIAGYMFGPIIGIICATITDMLVMLFVPSYINPIYIFCVILTGFIAGIAGVIKQKLHHHSWIIFLLINFFIILFAGGGAYLAFNAPYHNLRLFESISLSKYIVAGIIAGGGAFTLLIIYLTLFYYWKKGQLAKARDILPIILLAVISEYLIITLVGSYADMQLLSPDHAKDYGLTLIIRISMAPLKIIINSTIIYITWKTVSPLINIDNRN